MCDICCGKFGLRRRHCISVCFYCDRRAAGLCFVCDRSKLNMKLHCEQCGEVCRAMEVAMCSRETCQRLVCDKCSFRILWCSNACYKQFVIEMDAL